MILFQKTGRNILLNTLLQLPIIGTEARKRLEKLEFVVEWKQEKETEQEENDTAVQEELVQQSKGYRNPYSSMLIESKNIIFRGAPGTGKSYLAKEIAADIISNGYFDDYMLLTEE